MSQSLAWWFGPADNRLPHGDGREVAVGVTHTVEGPLVLCERGLHWSENILSALSYGGGSMLWRVRYSGDVVRDRTKGCSTERTYLRGAYAEAMLCHFARLCALDVVGLWDAPDVVVRYLRTGDDSLRDVASAASRAAWPAFSVAAWAGAMAVEAAWAATWAGARAAWAGARAAWDAARAARDATMDGDMARQSRRLTRMARELLRTA